MRRGQPAERRPVEPGAGARSGTARLRLGPLRAHAGGALVPDRQPLLRLAVPLRAGAVPARAAGLPRARQAARRLQQHQRHDLPARQPDGLRALGRRSRHGDVGLRPLPALLQADGGVPGRGPSGRLPRPLRTARAGARPGFQPAVRCVLRGGAAGGVPAHRRRKRLQARGLRALRPQHPQGPAPVGGPRLPAPGPRPAEPRGRCAGAGHAGPLRRHARGRRGVQACQRGADPRACRRGDPLRRRDQLAPDAPAFGRGRRRRAESPRHRRGTGPARRRREPPGPPGGVRAARVRAAGLGRALPQVPVPPLGGAAVAARREGARGQQPLRGGRLRPRQRGRRLPQPDAAFPADRDPLRRLEAR